VFLHNLTIAALLMFVYNTEMLSREDIAFMYLGQLPFEPYPFQEEAIPSQNRQSEDCENKESETERSSNVNSQITSPTV